MFSRQEILKEWIKSTTRIRAGNGGSVTLSMCERERTTEHRTVLGKIHIKLRRKQGGKP